MHTIQVDDEIFSLLQENAKAFVDSPNSTLRKMLGLRANGAIPRNTKAATDDLDELLPESTAAPRTKAPKANLRILVQAGLLRDGESLYLVDYQGKRLKFEAVVSGAYLGCEGQHYTMSKLASELLKKVGFQSNSVRGPSHWVNAKKVSVTELWQQFLNKQAEK